MPVKPKDPYNRIIAASKNGTGVHLNSEEVRALANDTAIEDRAEAIAGKPRLWADQLDMGKRTLRYFGP